VEKDNEDKRSQTGSIARVPRSAQPPAHEKEVFRAALVKLQYPAMARVSVREKEEVKRQCL